jgi:hypothetical protein
MSALTQRVAGPAAAGLWPELAALDGVTRVRHWGPYRVRRVHDPARVLGHTLQDLCVRSTSLGFGVDLTSYWASRPNYFEGLTDWDVVDLDGELAAWHGVSLWYGTCGSVLYSDMLVTLPRHRRLGLAALLIHDAWLHAAATTRSVPIIACRTQSPVVLAMLVRFATVTYPRLDGCGRDTRHGRALEAAHVVAIHKGARHLPAPDTFVGRAAFASPLCEQMPRCGDPRIERFFAEQLDRDRGDGVYGVGLLTPWGVARGFGRFGALRAGIAIRPKAGTRGRRSP